MTWRAWFRVLALTVALLVAWACSYAIVEYHVATTVSAERLARAEQQLIEQMLEAGRSIEEIRRAVENLNERYGDEKDNQAR